VKKDIVGFFYDDNQTKEAIIEIDQKYGYTADPHGAIGYLALQAYQKNRSCTGIFLETAHPGKFLPTVEGVLGRKIEIPESLSSLADLEKSAHKMSKEYVDFKSFLLDR